MARIAVFLLLLATLALEPSETRIKRQAKLPMTYYISPEGSDKNIGTLNAPWQTLAHALKQVSPGDVLNLGGGIYYEQGIIVDATGTASAPIIIQSYPGERAVIDGGVPFFMTVPNAEWELVDSDLQLYRSRRNFSDEGDFVRAWLADDDIQLLEYESAENLESTNYGPLDGLEPVYVGPGVQLRDDGHVYIRLVYNPHDLSDAAAKSITPTPRDTNPNNNRIAISFSDYIFRLDGVSYLQIKDMDFVHADSIFDVRSSSDHLVLNDCRMNFGNQGILIREESHDWEITGCEFNNGVPDYIYWTDVKNRSEEVAEAYPEFQSTAISGPMINFNIHHNLFRDTFDALNVKEGSRDTRITNNIFKHMRDDAINLSRGISNVEVAHNLIWHVMGGIANLSSDMPPGHVYIHHNIIDNSAYQRGGRPGNYREDNWPVWTIGSPFPGHDDGSKDSWWKLYNNTVVTRQDTGHRFSAVGPDEVVGNPNKYVLNNIFYVVDERVIFRNELMTDGSHFDGNVFYRGKPATLPLFLDFGDGSRYYSLQEFWVRSGTDWESHGLEVDPGFDPSGLDETSFDPEMIWERYRPTNPAIFTMGVAYDGLDWPMTQGVNYRGAIPDSEGVPTFLPLIRYGLRDCAELFPVRDTQRSCVLDERYSYVR